MYGNHRRRRPCVTWCCSGGDRSGGGRRGGTIASTAITASRVRCGRSGDNRHAGKGLARFVTGGTGDRGHNRVVHGRTGERRKVRGRVTGLAGGAGVRDMSGRRTRSLDVVVARCTAGADPRMIEDRTGPTDRGMTRIALEVGIDVLRPLALGLHVVVAGGAAAPRLGMIKIHRRVPSYRCMTTVTTLRRQNVGGRLGGSAHGGADPVTGGAVARGSFEYRVGVTQLALQIAMLPDQLEAGGQVIELLPQLLRRAGRRCCQQGGEQKQALQQLRAIHEESAQSRALEAVGRMAPLALPAVLTEMNIVLLVAGQTRRVEFYLVGGLFVAAGARQPCVCAIQCKAGLLAMVEIPLSPAVG